MFTSDYLNVFFQVIFADTPEAEFVSSLTEITGSDFRLGEPTGVDFKTTMTFAATSMNVPPKSELDMFLRSAFEGDNAATYTSAVVAGLPETNIFATTTQVSFSNEVGGATERRIGFISIGAVAAFLLVLGGAAVYNNRKPSYSAVEKPNDGHLSVAGYTIRDDRSLETQDRTERSEDDDDDHSTLYGGISQAQRMNSILDMPPRRYRLNTLPPEFSDAEEDDDSVGAIARVKTRKETPAERRQRMETVSF